MTTIIKLPGGRGRKVERLDARGRVIATFRSVREAAAAHGVTNVAITRAIHRGGRSAGSRWRYEDETGMLGTDARARLQDAGAAEIR